MRKRALLIFIMILVLGAFFRFYHITTTPPGLYPDEAMNGSNGLEALHTTDFSAKGGPAFGWNVFYPDNNGREGLFINIQAISVWFFGRTPWALRAVAAIFGALTILGVYLAARELFENYNIPLLAAFFTATSYWHINFSRIGFRAITTPFFLSFGLAFLLRGFRRNSIWDMVIAGIFTGLGFQGYIAFRFAPFVFAVPILWQLGRWWKNHVPKNNTKSEPRTFAADFRSNTGEQQAYGVSGKKGVSCSPCAIILFLFITFVAALPIGWYFLKHPADFIGRSKEVSVLSAPSPILEFAKTNALTLGMFFVKGDCNDRHNYNCKPELNPLVAIFFAIGLYVVLWDTIARTRNFQFSISNFQSMSNDSIHNSFENWKLKIRNSTLLAWLIFMSLPETLTREGIPHALRSIGMIPPVMILAGLGAYAAFQFALSFPRKRESSSTQSGSWIPDQVGNDTKRKMIYYIAVLLALVITFQTYYDYFIAWAPRTQTADAFATDLWHLGQYLNSAPQNIKKYVIADVNSDQNGGLPVVAETVAFATDTFRPQERAQKNLTYILSRDALSKIEVLNGESVIIAPLQKNDPATLTIIREKFPQFKEIRTNDFLIFQNF